MIVPIQWVQLPPEPPADRLRPDRVRNREILFLPQAMVVQDYLATKGIRHCLHVLVDGYSATSRVIRQTLALVERTDVAPEFPYPLNETTTLETADRLLSKLVLGRLIGSRTRRQGDPRIQAIVQYPYQATYAEDRQGRIRYDLTDPMTGKRAGSNIRQGLLKAFASREPDPVYPARGLQSA